MVSPFSDYSVSPDNFITVEESGDTNGAFASDNESSFAPFVEHDIPTVTNPLSGTALKTAMDYNRTYKTEHGWEKYAKDILRLIGVTDDSWIVNSSEENLKFFTIQFANWQDINHFKTNLKGVFGLNNWTYFQKKLGYHNLGNTYSINVDKAISGNKSSAGKWGPYKNDIYQQFQAKGIVSKIFPLNEEYFAYAVAEFQAKTGGLKIDGIIGDRTFASLVSGGVSSMPASGSVPAGTGLSGDLDYKYRELKSASVQQLATNYMDVLNNLRHLLPIEIEQIKKELQVSADTHSWISPAFSVVATIVAVVAIPFTGGASITLAGGGLMAASGALGIAGTVIQDYDNRSAQQAANDKNNANDVVLSGIRSSSDLSITQFEVEKFIKDVNDKKKLTEFLAVMRKLEEITRSTKEVRKYALLSVIKYYKATCQLIVHYRNDAPIFNWIDTDVDNVKKYFELKVEFFQDRPSDFFFSGLTRYDGDSARILKGVWNLWTRDFLMKDATTFRNYFIVFRTYFKEYQAPGFWDLAGKVTDVPYDVYISDNDRGELSRLFYTGYNTLDSIYHPDPDKIFLISPTTKKRQAIAPTAVNSKGLRYDSQIFLPLVNYVMNRDFNAGSGAKKVNYVEGELALTSEAYPEYENIYESLEPVSGSSFFSPEKNNKATSFNQSQVQKSGLGLADIMAAFGKSVDIQAIRQTLISLNQSNSSSPYRIDASGASVDSVFTEAVHQFQLANYLNPSDQDGVIGQSTLETLGIFNHTLKSKLNSSGFYGQGQLNKSDIKSQVPVLTNNEFNSTNWYQFILKPAWLGVKITDGIHVLLFRKLKEAEQWLLSQPQYKGMSAAALGKALGFTDTTRYSGARLSAGKQAMHGFGLALDINVSGNPWIGAGWVQYDKVLLQERYRMISALKKASGNSSLPGDTIFEYLHSIAQQNGNDTRTAYSVLKQRNDEFINYLKSNSSELGYWRQSQSFANRNPLNGFLNLHPDLVYALRQIAGLAWGAMDFGPRASGDIMHFDLRTIGVGKFLCEKIGGYVPKSGHPVIGAASSSGEMMDEINESYEAIGDPELHEAIEEAWADNEDGPSMVG